MERTWDEICASQPRLRAKYGSRITPAATQAIEQLAQQTQQQSHAMKSLQANLTKALSWLNEDTGGALAGETRFIPAPGEEDSIDTKAQHGGRGAGMVPDRFHDFHPMPVGSPVTARQALHVGGTFDAQGRYTPIRQFAASQDRLEVVGHRGGEGTGRPSEVLVRNKQGEEAWMPRHRLRGKTTGRGHKLPQPTGQEEPYHRQHAAGTCQQGQTAAQTGCTPAGKSMGGPGSEEGACCAACAQGQPCQGGCDDLDHEYKRMREEIDQGYQRLAQLEQLKSMRDTADTVSGSYTPVAEQEAEIAELKKQLDRAERRHFDWMEKVMSHDLCAPGSPCAGSAFCSAVGTGQKNVDTPPRTDLRPAMPEMLPGEKEGIRAEPPEVSRSRPRPGNLSRGALGPRR